MNFTYKSYFDLIKQLKEHKYTICSYHNWRNYEQCVILRHDIDFDIYKSLQLANLECKGGVPSTYFVLLTSDFYNVFSKESCDCLKKIINCGHDVGLHFDEVRYPELNGNVDDLKEKIIEECRILSEAIEKPVACVSMHRPSKVMLDADLQIPNIINSYGSVYLHDFKYLSDSRRRWREPVEEIIKSERYKRLHILTHAFWYNEQEITLKESLSLFINTGNMSRYKSMNNNFTNLQTEFEQDEVLRP